MSCHTLAAGRVLGVRTRQLNSLYDYGDVEDVQLRSWNHIGLFTRNIGRADGYGSGRQEGGGRDYPGFCQHFRSP